MSPKRQAMYSTRIHQMSPKYKQQYNLESWK